MVSSTHKKSSNGAHNRCLDRYASLSRTHRRTLPKTRGQTSVCLERVSDVPSETPATRDSLDAMRGILKAAAYIPYRRLDAKEITGLFGAGGGRGTRTVASHDEDTTTMGVEASRRVLAGSGEPSSLTFVTPTPAYADKNNASTVHAALRLAAKVGAWDFGGSLRSSTGALLRALTSTGTELVVASDLRDGLPTSADEAGGGDGAAAILIGDQTETSPVIAEIIGSSTMTDEFLDRWRTPGDRRSRVWEERFGETRYLDLGRAAYAAALADAGIEADAVDRLLLAGLHARAVKAVGAKLAAGRDILGDPITPVTGQMGGAHPLILLTAALEASNAGGEVIVVLNLADGADALVLRTTDAVSASTSADPVLDQIAVGAPLPYAKFLTWRGMVTVEPPRRPAPDRVSSSAAWRSEDWKFGFVGSKDATSGAIHMPPARVSRTSGEVDTMEPVAMADTLGTIVTFTIDRMAYSPSPPVVFAIVDFDGGGRFPVELTDVDAASVAIGDRVAMTFRRLFTSDGIHDYFWKARPVRSAASTTDVNSEN